MALQHTRVVLVRTQFPGNLGATARIMRNFGLRDLVLVAPQADIHDRNARQMSTHGEAILDTARRELLEETGYTARQWARAGVLHPVISYSTEFIDIWFARDLTLGSRQLDSGEFLEVFTATPAELLAWCGNGRVTDAKTLTGALWLQNVLSGLWALDWQTTAP